MNRRGAVVAVLLLVVLVVAVWPAASAMASVPDPPPPPVTVNDFVPEDRNLSDCIGALERPGCGSEARGGWRQTMVFVAVAGGLALVFGRIAWSARRRNQRA